MEEKHTILIPITITEDNIIDIMEMAFIGSNYWLGDIKVVSKGKCKSKEDGYINILLKNGKLSISAPEDDADNTYKYYPLTISSILRGIGDYLKEYGDCIEKGGIDSGRLDVGDCDLILQYALFGEQVYG